MSARDDGGRAFPLENIARNGGNGFTQGGMSLRDYFAAKAMQGFCTGGTRGDPIQSLAYLAYLMADAMLAERAK